MGYLMSSSFIRGKITNLKVAPDTNQGIFIWQIRAITSHHWDWPGSVPFFGIGHFGGLHETVFDSDK